MGRYFLPDINTWCRYLRPKAKCAPGDQCLTELGLYIQQNSVFRVTQTLCKGSTFPFPLFRVPCSPYRRRYIFHGSESFSWTSAFTALPKYWVGSPAPAWLPSPSVLMFSRLPRLALVLDIWNKNTDTASSPAHRHRHPQDCPTESSVFKH